MRQQTTEWLKRGGELAKKAIDDYLAKQKEKEKKDAI